MRAALPFGLLVACSLAAPPAGAQLGGLVDRAKRQADRAAAEARDLRRDVESAADLEDKAEAEVGRARADVAQTVPTEQKTQRRIEQEIEGTEPMQAVRAAERDVNDVATADERAETAVRAEASRAEREVARQADVEGRVRDAAEQTDAAAAVRGAEREVRTVTAADERARREVRELERAVDRATDLN